MVKAKKITLTSSCNGQMQRLYANIFLKRFIQSLFPGMNVAPAALLALVASTANGFVMAPFKPSPVCSADTSLEMGFLDDCFRCNRKVKGSEMLLFMEEQPLIAQMSKVPMGVPSMAQMSEVPLMAQT